MFLEHCVVRDAAKDARRERNGQMSILSNLRN